MRLLQLQAGWNFRRPGLFRFLDQINLATHLVFVAGKDHGAILANAGHFNVEVCIPDIEAQSASMGQVNEHTVQYNLKSGSRVYLIGEGRLVNLAAAEGHPVDRRLGR